MSDSREQWGPIEGEQEGESGAFRAPKGQEFPTCESREGHRVSLGAKGQEVSTWESRNILENQKPPRHMLSKMEELLICFWLEIANNVVY